MIFSLKQKYVSCPRCARIFWISLWFLRNSIAFSWISVENHQIWTEKLHQLQFRKRYRKLSLYFSSKCPWRLQISTDGLFPQLVPDFRPKRASACLPRVWSRVRYLWATLFIQKIEGNANIYFKLAAQFRTQDEPAYCGPSTLGTVDFVVGFREFWFSNDSECARSGSGTGVEESVEVLPRKHARLLCAAGCREKVGFGGKWEKNDPGRFPGSAR